MRDFAKACTGCNTCVKECRFLGQNGNPKKIIADILEERRDEVISFDCSLCGLCASSCPQKLDPSRIFLSMRQRVFARKGEVLDGHKGIMAYEKRGLSQRFSLYKIPKGCDTVFFPGCALAGTRSSRTIEVYSWLKKQKPDMGMVLDCCAKPSHDLGRMEFFKSNFSAMENFLVEKKIKKVVTACPNCLWVFNTYAKDLTAQSVYTLMAENGNGSAPKLSGCVTVHDPCTARLDRQVHADVRKLIRETGLAIREMEHSREKTLCCGEGGTVFKVAPDFAAAWGITRKNEAKGQKIITYCAGCSEFLGKSMDTGHILDLVFDPEKTMNKKERRTRSPFTYIFRLSLKNKLAGSAPGQIFEKQPLSEKKGAEFNLSKFMVLLIIAAGIIGAKMTGMDQLISQENIQSFVQGFGPMAPLIFIFIVTLAPAFFLPGAPFIIAGGLIFGPVWGVVYGITGATAGACLAFLVARYAASDWIEAKITHPSFIRLKNATERHGWKIVALTRLIPLFPFNLLSYALGLSQIRFLTYFITSFICMLPGCVCYILLSSSIFDLLQGKFSIQFFVGAALLILLSFMPILFKKYKPDNL